MRRFVGEEHTTRAARVVLIGTPTTAGIINRSKIEGVRWFSFADGLELHLISTIKENATINKALHLALSTSNFDAFVKSLDAKSIAYSDWPGNPHKINVRADGINQIFFQDPMVIGLKLTAGRRQAIKID